MTRQFNQQVHCPNCGCWITHETSFGRWIRENSSLDSGLGYCIVDQDYLIHKFKTNGRRDFQCLMLVEIKTMGAELTPAQKDTLWLMDRVMRNRRKTPTSQPRHQAGGSITKLWSFIAKKEIILKAFGTHVLTFSGLGPYDSNFIKWDKKNIEINTLTQLLKFDLDPDTLLPLDLRNHHNLNKNQQELPFLIDN